MSTLNDQFDPSVRCRAIHPYYGEQCFIHGGLAHKGMHRAMIAEGRNTKFLSWEDSPLDVPPAVPWSQRPRGVIVMVLAIVLGLSVAVIFSFWLAMFFIHG